MRKVLIVGIAAVAMSVVSPAGYARGLGVDPNGQAGMTAGSGFFDYLADLFGWSDRGIHIDPNGGDSG